MKKILLMALIVITGTLSVLTVSSQLTSNDLQNATFTPEVKIVNRYSGIITFYCGKKLMNVTLDEPDMNIDDDFEDAVAKVCHDTVTNARDWTGRYYKENEIGVRSFDESKLVVEVPEEDQLNKTGW